MAESAPKIRLYVDADLKAGQGIALREQAHYLVNVMRQGAGDRIELFNGRDGAWSARILRAAKRSVDLECEAQTAPQSMPPDVELLFAPIKKARTDFIVEKATELGVRHIRPVFTRFTNAERVRPEKLHAHCIEAAEQCGGTFVPELWPAQPLDAVLDNWPTGRRLMFCDERMDAPDAASALRAAGPGAWSILIGPEGGFSSDESARLRTLPFATTVTLGPRILRADTAAVAALTLWQTVLGDW